MWDSGAAVGGDQGEHPARVEGRGVGGGEVDRGEHEGLLDLGDPGGLLAAQLGDDAGADIAHVGGTLGHVPAETLEHAGDLVTGLPDGARRRLAAGGDEALRGLGEGGIRGHLRGGLEDLLPVPGGALGQSGQRGLHGGGGLGDPRGLGGGVGPLGELLPRRRLGDRRAIERIVPITRPGLTATPVYWAIVAISFAGTGRTSWRTSYVVPAPERGPGSPERTGGGCGIRTRGTGSLHNGFQDHLVRPL